MKKILTVAVGDPDELAAFLTARMGAVDVARGGVQVDGQRARDPRMKLSPGMKIIVRTEERATGEPRIVFEDDWLLVADKPAGMPSQATRADAAGALDAWAQSRNPDARLVHRLDRDASGLILISQKFAARAPLQEMLGRIERRYLALVEGELGEGEIDLRIARDPGDERRRRALPKNDPNGQPALTRYRAVGKRGPLTLVELTLETGRTHQIRVHLSASGHAIAGDPLYGGAPAERLMLHAHALGLAHPRDGRALQFSSPAPIA
jgi:RluA family pseudouridine synthase